MISASKFALSQVARHQQVQVTKAAAVTIGEMTVAIRSFQSHTSPAVRRYNRKQKTSFRGKPTMKIADAMAIDYPEMDNQSLITIAAMENHEARCEVLKRHIMTVDKVSYEKASITFKRIAKENRRFMALAALPYQIGFSVGTLAACASIPMVFDLGTAEWFNHHYVTTEVPEPADLESIMEVGSWTWNWMEPPLGTLSFVLLCLQFSRAQMANLGIRPFTGKLKEKRAQQLIISFPKYDAGIIEAFSETDPIILDKNPNFLGDPNHK